MKFFTSVGAHFLYIKEPRKPLLFLGVNNTEWHCSAYTLKDRWVRAMPRFTQITRKEAAEKLRKVGVSLTEALKFPKSPYI
jgi:hypothetical protein